MDVDVSNKNNWEIEVECLPKLNFSLQQSKVPFIRRLIIYNNTNNYQENIRLQISTSPQFISTKIIEIDHLDAGASLRCKSCETKLDYDYFAALSEIEKTTLSLKLSCKNKNDDAEQILAEKIIDIDALPANAWTGLSPMPQLLASFVTPNLNSISEMQRQMSALLARDGLDDAKIHK